MNYKLKILLISAFVFADVVGYGQMTAGNYPFQLVDSLVFENGNNLFQIDTKRKSDSIVAGITNYSSDTILIPIQDNSVISILEAKNKNGLWKPIQFWPISGCGNSYYSKSILPNQTLLFKVKKDFGESSTLMRLRLHGTDTIFVSNEFIGSVSEDMFKIKNNIIKNYRYILCDSIFYLESPLFGNLNFDGHIEIAKPDENE